MKASDFSGKKCGTRYEQEYVDKFRDCIIFYFDENIRFERFCYGEGACLVYGVWGKLLEDGSIEYKKPFEMGVEEHVLPKKLTKIDGETLYFDDKRLKWDKKVDFSSDSLNGYSGLSNLMKKIFKQ